MSTGIVSIRKCYITNYPFKQTNKVVVVVMLLHVLNLTQTYQHLLLSI